MQMCVFEKQWSVLESIGSLCSHACHSLSNGTATVYLFFIYDVVIIVVLAPCMDPKDRK